MMKRGLAVALTAVLLLGLLTACKEKESKDETVTPTTASSAETTTTTTAVTVPVCYVTATKLNVRSAPSTDGTLVGALLYGEAVEILDTVDGWHLISYAGVPGYISADYVSLTPPPSRTTAAPTTGSTYPAHSVLYVTATKLNIRREPAASGDVLGLLLYGEAVEILDTVNGWCQIQHNGGIAYVSADYLSPNPPPSTTAASTTVTTQ